MSDAMDPMITSLSKARLMASADAAMLKPGQDACWKPYAKQLNVSWPLIQQLWTHCKAFQQQSHSVQDAELMQ